MYLFLYLFIHRNISGERDRRKEQLLFVTFIINFKNIQVVIHRNQFLL
jgi:hypothetical protein